MLDERGVSPWPPTIPGMTPANAVLVVAVFGRRGQGRERETPFAPPKIFLDCIFFIYNLHANISIATVMAERARVGAGGPQRPGPSGLIPLGRGPAPGSTHEGEVASSNYSFGRDLGGEGPLTIAQEERVHAACCAATALSSCTRSAGS